MTASTASSSPTAPTPWRRRRSCWTWSTTTTDPSCSPAPSVPSTAPRRTAPATWRRRCRSPPARTPGAWAPCWCSTAGWQARGVRKIETLASGPSPRPAGVRPCASRRRPSSRCPGSARPAPFDLDSAGPAAGRRGPPYVGVDDALLRAAVAAGARGVVLQALGAGNAPPSVTESVAGLVASGVPVLVTSRVGSRSGVAAVCRRRGRRPRARAGAVFAADLSPWQARLLLSARPGGATDDPAPPSPSGWGSP